MIISFNLPNTEILTNIKNLAESPIAILQVVNPPVTEEGISEEMTIVPQNSERPVFSNRTTTRLFIGEKDAKRLRHELKDFYADQRFSIGKKK